LDTNQVVQATIRAGKKMPMAIQLPYSARTLGR